MKKASQAELEIIADVRCASLIKRWLAEKKLSAEEKDYVAQHGHIQREILDQGPSSPDAKQAVAGQLDRTSRSTRKHAKYKEKLPHYASIFGQTERTIKRWIRRGKELPHPIRKGELDLPPLDDPPKMAGWWRRCMDHQVPDYILAIAAPPDPHAANSDDRSTTGETGEESKPRDFSQVKSLDIRQNVEALRQTHAINKHKLDEALAGTNETEIQLRQKNFERSFELLRKGEQTLVDLEKQRGTLIDQESVRVELSQIFESLRLMRETMPRRILSEMERLGYSNPEVEKYLLPATEKVRGDEEEIFRKLETLDGPETVKKLLDVA